jgi:2-polyprenyl-3-methyl-5-hydroxy-6-metoxy-1,4-benzoquinol methylase
MAMANYVNQEGAAVAGEHVGFSFGANWRKFLATLTDQQIAEARRSLISSFAGNPIAGEAFIDVGCGSGLFSLGAIQLGCPRVVSIDVDPDALHCAQQLRDRFPSPAEWKIRSGSVLDEAFLRSLGTAPLVFSWGVLHHTGSMWKAISNTLTLVQPGGLLCLALYNRPGRPRLQLTLKRTYNRAPRELRPAMRGAYGGALLLALMVLGRRNPIAYVRNYGRRSRGMTFWRDVEDWLGGLPFEFATVEQVRKFAETAGFSVEHIVERSPGGCNEYLLRRPT